MDLKKITPYAVTFLLAVVVSLGGANLYLAPQLAELGAEGRGGGVTRFNSKVEMNAGAVVANGLTANAITSTGAATISSGGLTVTAGGATVTAGGVTVTAGGANIVDGNLTLADFAVLSPGTTISVTAGATITPTASYQPIQSASAVTTSTSNAIADGAASGAVLILRNTNASDAITVDGAGANVECNGNIAIGANDVLTLIWNGTDWTCLSLRDNSP